MLYLLFGILLRFSWEPTPGPAPTGYKIYIGNSPNNLTQVIDVGNHITKDVEVDITTTKYVAVTSYNMFGESAPSVVINVGKPGVPHSIGVTVVGR